MAGLIYSFGYLILKCFGFPLVCRCIQLLGRKSQCLDFHNQRESDVRRSVPAGSFAQSMVVVRGNILLLLGGYSGTMTNDVYAYTAPPSLALNKVSSFLTYICLMLSCTNTVQKILRY